MEETGTIRPESVMNFWRMMGVKRKPTRTACLRSHFAETFGTLWGMNRKAYPSDVGDEEWSFVAPYLTLMIEEAPQRDHDRREVFNGLRWIVRTGAQWRMMPHDLPPWAAVYQQTQRWLRVGVFEAIVIVCSKGKMMRLSGLFQQAAPVFGIFPSSDVLMSRFAS